MSKSEKKLRKILKHTCEEAELHEDSGLLIVYNFVRKQHIGRDLLKDFTYFQGKATFENIFRWLLLRNGNYLYKHDCRQ